VTSLTIVVKYGEFTSGQTMSMKKPRRHKPETANTVQATVSFPIQMHERLKPIAKRKRVSLAWVVPEALEDQLAENKRPGSTNSSSI
jgi:hypothetical protein